MNKKASPDKRKRARTYTRPLTSMQKRFIAEYPLHKNQTAAAIAAGYKASSAAVVASTLVRDPRIVQRLDINAHKRMRYREKTQGNILDELAKLGFANILDFFDGDGLRIPLADLPRDVAAAVKDLKVTRSEHPDTKQVTESVELKLHDKKSALEQLGKNQGMWIEKSQVEGIIGHAFIAQLQRTVGPMLPQQEKPEAED